MRNWATILGFTAAAGAATACGGGKGADPLGSIDALVILQRAPRMGGVGDIFQYTSYVPGARLIKLDPPTADGTITELCCSQFGAEFADMDIQAYDIAFDARSIVMSARLKDESRYGLFLLTLNDEGVAAGPPVSLATNPNRDYVYPIFAAQDRVVFMTNEEVEQGAPQHQDEYERGTTTQLASVSTDGTGLKLGPRNLSHRVAPTMLHTGHIMFTQWDHLGDENSGHLMMTNADFTNLREVYGKEGRGRTNSYLKAVQFPTNASEYDRPDVRLVTIATSRDRTLQSGKLLDVTIGVYDAQGVWRQAEVNAQVTDHTPQVPGDRQPSLPTVGRYYDAYPVRADESAAWTDKPAFVVSWADGPVEEMTLGTAGLQADFGIYLYDSRSQTRRPIFNDEAKWDIMARPLATRNPPREQQPAASNGITDTGALIGSLNVYDISLGNTTIEPGSVVAVRILEGFSVEEGVPDDFGLTEHEGAALLGEAPVYADGSWAATIPANVPIHLQAIDKFGLSIVNEPVWFSAAPGESRFCGGCHEKRDATTVIQPGVTIAMTQGAALFDKPRAQRQSLTYTRDAVVGVPWEDEAGRPGRTALQTVFDQKCISCHDGDPNKAGNKSITITDTETGDTQTIVFDLRGGAVSYGLGTVMMSGYSRSHLSIMGPDMMELEEAGISFEVTGDMPIYVEPGNARESLLIQKLNPPQLYPYDPNVRAFPGQPVHPADVGGVELTEDEYYLFILMADAGGQFYSRENTP